MRKFTLFTTIPAVLLGIVLSFCLIALPASAQTPVELLFELDGNAIDQSNIDGPDDVMPPDDWAWGNGTGSWDYVAGPDVNENPPPGGLAHLSSFIADPNGDTGVDDIFVGGASKDDLHIKAGWGSNGWKWDFGTAPDKDDLLGVAAAAYIPIAGELLIYDFGSLYAANGASSIGNWFFKKDIGPCADGTFGVVNSSLEGRPCLDEQPDKIHSIGDVLIISENTIGGTITNISVYKWIGNDPAEVQKCEDREDYEVVPPKDNLCLISEFAGATCDGDINTNPFACGGMNQEVSESPDTYGYMSKSPPDPAVPFPAGTDGIDADDYPAFTFFESGINISKVLEDTECFSSFMKSTRTSHEPRSRLKDFASGAFELCGIDVFKSCEATLNDTGDEVGVLFDGWVENTGVVEFEVLLFDDAAGSEITKVCYDVNGTPDECDAGDSLPTGLAFPEGAATFKLGPGETVLYEGTYTVLAPITSLDFDDTVTADAKFGGMVIDSADYEAKCSAPWTAGISVTKDCDPSFINGDTFKAVITGTVKNEGTVQLVGVELDDDVIDEAELAIEYEDSGLPFPNDGTGTLDPKKRLLYSWTLISQTQSKHENTMKASGYSVFHDSEYREAFASTDDDRCKVNPVPEIKITKDCDTSINGTGVQLLAEGGVLMVEVGNIIKVENIGNEVLTQVEVSDSEVALSTAEAGWDCTTTPGVCVGSLGLSESITFTQTYYPDGDPESINGALNNPGSLYFLNEATAVGVGVLSDITAGPWTADASCKLCPCPGSCD